MEIEIEYPPDTLVRRDALFRDTSMQRRRRLSKGIVGYMTIAIVVRIP